MSINISDHGLDSNKRSSQPSVMAKSLGSADYGSHGPDGMVDLLDRRERAETEAEGAAAGCGAECFVHVGGAVNAGTALDSELGVEACRKLFRPVYESDG